MRRLQIFEVVMRELDVAIRLSDLFEAVDAEGGLVATLIDQEVLPYLTEAKTEFGLGARFDRVIDKVRATANRAGRDRIRTLKDMMKSALADFARRTHDVVTAREIYHRAIMAGSDIMLTCTAAAILANALYGQHPDEAKSLLQQIASRLSGKQPAAAMESCSSAAVGAGAVATGRSGKKKRRRDSIFVEADVVPLNRRSEPVANPAADDPSTDQTNVARLNRPEPAHPFAETRAVARRFGWVEVGSGEIGNASFVKLRDPKERNKPRAPLWIYSNGAWDHRGFKGRTAAELAAYLKEAETLYDHVGWDDLIGNPANLDVLREVSATGVARHHSGVLVDPTTAELVLSVHQSIPAANRRRFASKSLDEMIRIANRCVKRGLIEVCLEEA